MVGQKFGDLLQQGMLIHNFVIFLGTGVEPIRLQPGDKRQAASEEVLVALGDVGHFQSTVDPGCQPVVEDRIGIDGIPAALNFSIVFSRMAARVCDRVMNAMGACLRILPRRSQGGAG